MTVQGSSGVGAALKCSILLVVPLAGASSNGNNRPSTLPPCNASDEQENIRRAYAFAKHRQFNEALPCLLRAASHFPYIAKIHTDIGRATLRLVRRRSFNATIEETAGTCETTSNCNHVPDTDDEFLQQGYAALWLATVLGDNGAHKHRQKYEQAYATSSDSAWARITVEGKMLERILGERSCGKANTADVVRIVTELCDTPDGAAVNVSAEEAKHGRLSPKALLAAHTRLQLCGIVELRGPIVPLDVLAAASSWQTSTLERTLNAGSLDGTAVVERWQRRFEQKVPLIEPFTDPRLVASPQLLHLVRLALGPRVEIDTFSHVTALTGAPMQPWHTDVDLLFKEPDVADLGHLPPAGLVAVVPLINITHELGPTEFLAGSHVFVGHDVWETLQDPGGPSPEPPRIRPLLNMGSVLLFDLRLRHRGTSNRAETSRSILYLSYVKDWFLDRLNFRGHQSSALDNRKETPLRKLLRRVDARMYVDQLETYAAGRSTKAPDRALPFNEADLSI